MAGLPIALELRQPPPLQTVQQFEIKQAAITRVRPHQTIPTGVSLFEKRLIRWDLNIDNLYDLL
jgi:hypothetical protein